MGAVLRKVWIPLCVVILLFLIRFWSPLDSLQRISHVVTEPIVFVVRTPLAFAGDRVVRFVTLWHADAENARLRHVADELRTRVLLLEGVDKENARLRQALGFATRPFILDTLIGADVTLRHPGAWFHSVEINKGEQHGVRSGMVVLTSEGVVGHVVQVFQNGSRVRLLTDLASAIPSSGERTKELGLLAGTGTNTLQWQYIPADSDIQEGDLIQTAGASAVYPEGLKLGYVARVATHPGELFKMVEVRPAVNLASLHSVFLVQSR